MYAVTIPQPWASLIVRGLISFDTWNWATDHCGPLVIHAAERRPSKTLSQYTEHIAEAAREALGVAYLDDLPRSALLGSVYLLDCMALPPDGFYMARNGQDDIPLWELNALELTVGDFSPGRYVWQYQDPFVFEQPIEIGGVRGLWRCATFLEGVKFPKYQTGSAFDVCPACYDLMIKRGMTVARLEYPYTVGRCYHCNKRSMIMAQLRATPKRTVN